jgi:ornithine cyclodeaminase
MRDWVRPGTHVNAVGSSHAGPVEIDPQLVAASEYFVDYRRSALAAAAEFIRAKELGLVDDGHIRAEIGEVLNGNATGRTDKSRITLYKSLGHIVQDLAAARLVHDRASGPA